MNIQNLNEIIERYSDRLEEFNNAEHDEIFKWEAVGKFQKICNDNSLPFCEKLSLALSKCSLLLNDGQVAPASGVIKLLEHEPLELQRLFEEVLFGDDNNDLSVRENKIDEFLVGINNVCRKYYPDSWMYKHDRKTAIAYLTLHSPQDNFFYKYSEVNLFATVLEYGIDIGSGESFSLTEYYKFCEIVRDEVNKHTDLVDRHKALRGDGYYADEQNNILVFDLIRSARAYNLCSGLIYAKKADTVKEYKLSQLREKERLEIEQKVAEFKGEIVELEKQIDDFYDINIIDTQVNFNDDTGIVISQVGNKVTVRFTDFEKSFVIHSKFNMRPIFENDHVIVDVFTKYGDVMTQIKRLENQIESLSV